VYLTRWPDPLPRVFGFHEVFHALIIIGCTCHFVAVARVATA
jgi:hemolysin III